MSDTLRIALRSGLEVTVGYDYDPAEPQVLYPNDRAHPGTDEIVTVTSVTVRAAGHDIDIVDDLSAECIEAVELDVRDHLRNLRDAYAESLAEDEVAA